MWWSGVPVHEQNNPDKAIPEDIKEYLRHTGRTRSQGRKLVGAMSASKMLIYVPLLLW